MQLVTEEEIYELVREQIQEEIIDMLSWQKAQFEFRETEPPEELRDRSRAYTTLTLNPTEVLLEAARRLDEWFARAEKERSQREEQSTTGQAAVTGSV